MKKTLILLLILALVLCGCGAQQNPGACTHSDENNDGVCDQCKQSVLVTVDFYAINDLHGKLQDGSNHPGVDEMTTYLKLASLSDEHRIVLSAGDTWQGSAESNLTQGKIMTDWMNDLGFAAMTLGNHEFDWGEEAIQANAEAAQFPLLAINVYDRETDQRVSYCDSSVVVEVGDAQIGIIGAIGDCYSSIAVDKVKDLYFKTGDDLTALVMEESQKLRKRGVDFIVYSIHDGYGDSGATPETSPIHLGSYYDIALSEGYVDLVFEGHTHQSYIIRDEYNVLHLQNRGDNRGGISHVEVTINSATGEFSVDNFELVSHSTYAEYEDDPIVEELLGKYQSQIAPGNQSLGYNADYRNSDDLRQLAAQMYYESGVKEWGEDYDIVLGGGFFTIRNPYNLYVGEVLYLDLLALFPFDNDLVLCSIRGSDLLDRFINSTNERYAVYGDRDTMRHIHPAGTYYVVVDTYTSDYAPNRLTVVEEYESGIYARDLLAEYIKNGGLE